MHKVLPATEQPQKGEENPNLNNAENVCWSRDTRQRVRTAPQKESPPTHTRFKKRDLIYLLPISELNCS